MTPESASLHFGQPLWLLALLVPLLVALWLRLTISRPTKAHVDRYADAHLLPHLLRNPDPGARGRRRRLTLWFAVWVLVVLAMAGPRWDYTDARMFKPGADLVVLLDLSRSMEAQDVLPSRLGRARQELEDLLAADVRARIGLIAFASVAHVVAPITEDRETLARTLPALSTDLVNLKGSRVAMALGRAERLLLGRQEENPSSLLLISDGDFAEPGLEDYIAQLAAKGIRLHVLGIGTTDGTQLRTADGTPFRDPWGQPVHSALNETLLRSLATAGGGTYRRADYRDQDTREVLEQVTAEAPPQEAEATNARIWHERFYWLAIPALLLLLPGFRKVRTTRTPQASGAGGNT